MYIRRFNIAAYQSGIIKAEVAYGQFVYIKLIQASPYRWALHYQIEALTQQAKYQQMEFYVVGKFDSLGRRNTGKFWNRSKAVE